MNQYIVTSGIKGIGGQQKVVAPDTVVAAQICDFPIQDITSVVFMEVVPELNQASA